MKKIFIFLIVLGVLGIIYSQIESYDSRHAIMIGTNEADLLKLVRVDSSGVLYFASAIFDSCYTDTCTATVDCDTLTFRSICDLIIVYCDEANESFWVAFNADSSIQRMRIAPGAIVNIPIMTDSLTVWKESGSSKITALGIIRKGY